MLKPVGFRVKGNLLAPSTSMPPTATGLDNTQSSASWLSEVSVSKSCEVNSFSVDALLNRSQTTPGGGGGGGGVVVAVAAADGGGGGGVVAEAAAVVVAGEAVAEAGGGGGGGGGGGPVVRLSFQPPMLPASSFAVVGGRTGSKPRRGRPVERPIKSWFAGRWWRRCRRGIEIRTGWVAA